MKKVLVIAIAFGLFVMSISFLPVNTAHTENDPYVVDLIAGKHTDAGDVLVWNDGDYLYVKYVADEGWMISETHLHVGEDIDDFPTAGRWGNPVPGLFDYNNTHEPWVNNYTYEIEMTWDCDTELYIAAHAVVKEIEFDEVCIDFEDEEYNEFDNVTTVATEYGDVNFYMTDWMDLIGISYGDTADLQPTGEYPIITEPQNYDTTQPAYNIAGFTVNYNGMVDDWVKEDPFDTGAGGKLLTDPIDKTKVDLQQHAHSNFQSIVIDLSEIEGMNSLKLAGVDLDWNENWYAYYFNEEDELLNINQYSGNQYQQTKDGHAIPIYYENEDITKVALYGYNNQAVEDRVGYAFDNICYNVTRETGSETAWGEGDRFVDRGNWGMYFGYHIQCPCVDYSVNFCTLEPGTSVEGLGTVHEYLNIQTADGTAVKVMEGVAPRVYGADNDDLDTNKGVDTELGGFSDIVAKNAGAAHGYTFTFADGIEVTNFSLHMLDFGDYNPSRSTYHYANMTAYNGDGDVVDVMELEYNSDGKINPRSSSIYGDLWYTGDAVDAEEGEPGNWTWNVSGEGIVRIELYFGEGYDPNIAFDHLNFTVCG